MKASRPRVSLRPHPARRALALATAVSLLSFPALAAVVDLGVASSFAVLAGAGITNTGTTTLYGDAGTSPTPSMTGFGTVTFINGTNHGNDAITQAAKVDLVSAYDDLAAMSPATTLAGAYDLGGTSPLPGVYHAPESLAITGQLTLNAGGDANAFWVFKTDFSLITGTGSSVLLSGGATAANVFWLVGSSATLGTDSRLAGTVVALQSITANTGAIVEGGLLARNGTVTLQGNLITAVPEPTGATLVVIGLACLLNLRRRIV